MKWEQAVVIILLTIALLRDIRTNIRPDNPWFTKPGEKVGASMGDVLVYGGLAYCLYSAGFWS